jgi:hypothetical protein
VLAAPVHPDQDGKQEQQKQGADTDDGVTHKRRLVAERRADRLTE